MSHLPFKAYDFVQLLRNYRLTFEKTLIALITPLGVFGEQLWLGSIKKPISLVLSSVETICFPQFIRPMAPLKITLCQGQLDLREEVT